MKVYDNCPKPGRIWSIEVSSSIGRRAIARLIATIPGVQMTQMPTFFSWLKDEPFCRFEFNGRRFAIEAVWPIGRRFEITPEPCGCVPEILTIREALLKARR